MKFIIPLIIVLLLAGCQKKPRTIPEPVQPPPVEEPVTPQPQPPPVTEPDPGSQNEEPAHQHHPEREIPTPIIGLAEAPLDVHESCSDVCKLLILNRDHLVIFDWKEGAGNAIALKFPSTIQSRDPSGKILNGEQFGSKGFILLHQNFEPLQYNPETGELSLYECGNCPFPKPARGYNYFESGSAAFFDFVIVENVFAGISTNYALGVQMGGVVTLADFRAGSSIATDGKHFYISSPVQYGQPDSISKIDFVDTSFTVVSTKQLDGEVYDLAITDLDRNDKKELLITLKTAAGIFVEVHELL